MTFHDELMGTRSKENAVKSLKNRKADREGQSLDFI